MHRLLRCNITFTAGLSPSQGKIRKQSVPLTISILVEACSSLKKNAYFKAPFKDNPTSSWTYTDVMWCAGAGQLENGNAYDDHGYFAQPPAIQDITAVRPLPLTSPATP